MTCPGDKLTALTCHPTQKVNKAEDLTSLSLSLSIYLSISLSIYLSLSLSKHKYQLQPTQLVKRAGVFPESQEYLINLLTNQAISGLFIYVCPYIFIVKFYLVIITTKHSLKMNSTLLTIFSLTTYSQQLNLFVQEGYLYSAFPFV
jgi:hypothetical protein